MLSQTAEYALRAVVALGLNTDRHLTNRDIAELTKVPVCYLAKVLQALVRAGLVASHRGSSGGFGLVRSPEQVTLLDVVSAVDPVGRIITCPLKIDSHGNRLCGLHRRLDAGLSMIETLLACSTIAEVIDDPDAGVPLCESDCATTRPPH
jgi:Rrf2 family transcriptional regulator, nitric oxide-sensitive transcriptional repressor